VAAPKVLLVVAHPVIASGLETLLRLEGDYDVKRVASISEAAQQRAWGAQVALVDGTLLGGLSDVNIGAPSYVLSGSERDGRQLSRKLDDGRGWLRKDATGPELAAAIASLMRGEETAGDGGGGLGTLGVVTVVVLCVIVLALVAYLVWLAVY
jgi:DNA-binding NarL/FixJ family response regulator